MDQLTHLAAAAAFVGSLTALVVLGIRALDQALDRRSTRRRIQRRLMAIGR